MGNITASPFRSRPEKASMLELPTVHRRVAVPEKHPTEDDYIPRRSGFIWLTTLVD